jgi:hypothetical protein
VKAKPTPPVAPLVAPVRLTIIGAPRTKGNHGVIVAGMKRPLMLPSKPYRAWFKAAMQQVPLLHQSARQQGATLPIEARVIVNAVFYLDADRAVDEDNLKKGLGDFLKAAKPRAGKAPKPAGGILRDDTAKRLRWGAITVAVDRKQPRIELLIEPWIEPV